MSDPKRDLEALLDEHSWDGYHPAHGVMCACGWRSFDGDPEIKMYDAYAGHEAEVIIAAGWVSPEEHATYRNLATAAAVNDLKRAKVAEAKVARVEALVEEWEQPGWVPTGIWVTRLIRAALAEPLGT